MKQDEDPDQAPHLVNSQNYAVCTYSWELTTLNVLTCIKSPLIIPK